MGVSVFTYRFVPPGLPFTSSDDQKFNHGEIDSNNAELSDYPEFNEMLGIIIRVDDRRTSGISASVKFYNDDTGKLLWEGSQSIQDPQDAGWEWWNWQKIKFWIGHADWEINGPMLVRIEMDAEGKQWVRKIRVSGVVAPPDNRIRVTFKALKEDGNPLQDVKVNVHNDPDEFTDSNGTHIHPWDPTKPFDWQVSAPGGWFVLSDGIGSVSSDNKSMSGTSNITADATLNFKFTQQDPNAQPPAEELPGFWQRLKDLYDGVLGGISRILTKAITTAINNLHFVLFSSDIDEETARSWADHLPGFNAMHVYAFGTDFNGVTREVDESIDHTDLALALMPLGTGKAAAFSAQIFKKGGKSLTQKFMKNIAAKEAEIIGKGVGGKALQKFIENEMLRQAARDIISSKPVWKQIITLQGPVAKWIFAAASMMGIGAWASWPVADNLATMANIDGRLLLQRVENGEISKEEALASLDKLIDLFDKGKKFVDINFAINPVVRFLTPTFKLTTDAAEILINQTRQQIVDVVVTPPPEDKVSLTIESDPTQAKIYVNDEYVFELTPTQILLDPGQIKITLKKSGYNDNSVLANYSPGETKTIRMTLTAVDQVPPPDGTIPPLPPPGTPPLPGTQPEDSIEIPLDPKGDEFNAWKTTIKAVDSETGQELAAWILINDDFVGRQTPAFFFLFPESVYNIKLRLSGYKQGEVTFTTDKLPDKLEIS